MKEHGESQGLGMHIRVTEVLEEGEFALEISVRCLWLDAWYMDELG